jgi:tripartite-type tricarboxylate transporter receptor subunit TctC
MVADYQGGQHQGRVRLRGRNVSTPARLETPHRLPRLAAANVISSGTASSTKERLVSKSERRRTKVESPLISSKGSPTRRRVKATKVPRRQFLHLAAGAAALPAASRVAFARAYPSRPVRLIVPFAPAGGTDIFARLIGQWLSERVGQQFVIENRPGAGGNIGTEAVVRAPADGYTLLLVGPSNAINATLYDKLNFDLIRDLTPVAAISRVPNVMEVNLLLPTMTVPEFIAYARANPGKVNMASGGLGTLGHMNGELFKMMAGVDMLHVPYRGGGPALTDLIGGQVQLLFDPLPSSIEYVKAGTVRGLAVTSKMRSEALPEIPTLNEFLPGYEASFWVGVSAPRGIPAEIVGTLNRQINTALADPQFMTRLADLGGTVLARTPGDFGELIADETEKWAKVVKFSGAKAN